MGTSRDLAGALHAVIERTREPASSATCRNHRAVNSGTAHSILGRNLRNPINIVPKWAERGPCKGRPWDERESRRLKPVQGRDLLGNDIIVTARRRGIERTPGIWPYSESNHHATNP
jgi:hypothetical protein